MPDIVLSVLHVLCYLPSHHEHEIAIINLFIIHVQLNLAVTVDCLSCNWTTKKPGHYTRPLWL